ncbi:MAG: PC4/YdbC family ssDNA-binding protein [Oscillospiraceae bacterium]|nr:PC4/YdbC family ssDNA-binding protein [Oscillospiraceae bacterium]
MAEFKYEVKETLGVLSTAANGWERQLNLVSWNDREPKYDIRDWAPDHTKMGKGISMTADELAVLKDLLAEIDLDEL